VFGPLREGLEAGGEWSRFDNVLVARNVHVMLVRWMSDVHQRVKSARFSTASLKTPAACAELLQLYVKDLLTAARERRATDDWCVGGHVDFYRQGHGRYWFIIHPKIGGVQLLKGKGKRTPNPPANPQGGGGAGGGALPDPTPAAAMMRDGQRHVCALHLCGVLLRLKAKSRDGKEKLCRCLQKKGQCKFWHPMQVSQVTRSQVQAALRSHGIMENPDLATAAQAKATGPGLIWRAEPTGGADLKGAGLR
jgi:hypothetical protein